MKFADVDSDIDPETESRFWQKIDFGHATGCWPWKPSKGKYGTFKHGNKTVKTHKLAWVLLNGPIPHGMCVLHHCDNPPCCNPGHLFLGTMKDNARDRDVKHRGRVPDNTGRKRHEMQGEKHRYAKLTVEQVRIIRALKGEKTLSQVAKQFCVNSGTIYNIWVRRTWASV